MRNTAAALAAIALLALVVLAVVNCTKSDPVAGTGTEIQLSANPADIDLRTGTKSTITATVFNMSGTVQSGVALLFSTDTGRMESGGQRVKTNSSGVARDVLIVGSNDDGQTAKVTVRSGPQKADISVGVGNANKPPQAKFTAQPLVGHVNQPVTFDGSQSRDPNGDQTIEKMVWTLTSDNPDPSIPPDLQANCTRAGNKETCTFTRDPQQGLQTEMVRSFAYGQILTVSLDVFDDKGLDDTFTLSGIEIDWNTPPVANAGPDITTEGCRGFLVSAGQSSDPDGAIVRYDWDMGDGAQYLNRTSPQASHAYQCYAQCGNPPVPGPGCTYTVTLTVYDNGAPTAPGYTCDGSTHLCGGTATGTQSLTGIDTLKATVLAPISGTMCDCICGAGNTCP